MKLQQFACISLDQDYQKKGETNPEVKNKWVILNSQQIQQQGLNTQQPIIGPGKYVPENNNKLQRNLQDNSNQIGFYMNHLIVLYGQNLLFYRDYQLLLSNQAVQPTQVIQLSQPYDQFQIGRDYFFFISQKEISIQKCQQEQNLFKLTLIQTKPQLQYFNLAEKAIIITQKDQISFDTFSGQIETLSNKYRIATYQNQKLIGVTLDYLLSTNGINMKREFDILKQIFVIGDYVCVCGYQSENDLNSDGDEVIYYKSIIKWYQGNKLINAKEVDQKPRTKSNGDFNFLTIKDIVVIYGSYLDKVTFWQNGNEIQLFVGQPENMELNLYSQIRGACLIQMSPQLSIAISQQFKTLNRLPTIITLQANQNLVQYEILDIDQKIATYVEQAEQKQQSEIKLLNQKDDLIIVQSKELQELEEEPTCIEIKIKKKINNQEYKLPLGPGKINGTPKVPLHHTNLMINYFTLTVIGFQNSLILLDHINLERMLSNQNFNQKDYQIFNNQDEIVLNLSLFEDQILCISNKSAYVIEFGPNGEISVEKAINSLQDFHEVQVYGIYILIQTFKDGITKQLLYDDFELVKTFNYLAGCFYVKDQDLHLLFISQDKFYLVSNFQSDQVIRIDTKFKIDNGQHYYLQQLHKNKFYLGIAQIEDCEIIQKIVQIETSLSQVSIYRDDLFESAINDELQMASWNVQKFDISTDNNQLNSLIVIFCSYAQSGIAVQIRNNEIVEVFERTFSEAYKIPSHMGVLKGICSINFILPSEKFLNQVPGFLDILDQGKHHNLRLLPSILVMVQDIQNQQLHFHRNIILNLNQLDATDTAISLQAITIRESENNNQPKQQEPNKKPKRHQIDKYLDKSLSQLDGRNLDILSAEEGLYLSDELLEKIKSLSIAYYNQLTNILNQQYDQLTQEKQVLDKLTDFFNFYKLNDNKFEGLAQIDQKSQQLQIYSQFNNWFHNYIGQYFLQNSAEYHMSQSYLYTKNTYPTLGTLNSIANYFAGQIVPQRKRTVEFNQQSFLSTQVIKNDTKKQIIKNFIKILVISRQCPIIYYEYLESQNIYDTIREFLTDANQQRVKQLDSIKNQLEQPQNIKKFEMEEFIKHAQKFQNQEASKYVEKFKDLQKLRLQQQGDAEGLKKLLESKGVQPLSTFNFTSNIQNLAQADQNKQQFPNLQQAQLGDLKPLSTKQENKSDSQPSSQNQFQLIKPDNKEPNIAVQNNNSNDLLKGSGQSIFAGQGQGLGLGQGQGQGQGQGLGLGLGLSLGFGQGQGQRQGLGQAQVLGQGLGQGVLSQGILGQGLGLGLGSGSGSASGQNLTSGASLSQQNLLESKQSLSQNQPIVQQGQSSQQNKGILGLGNAGNSLGNVLGNGSGAGLGNVLGSGTAAGIFQGFNQAPQIQGLNPQNQMSQSLLKSEGSGQFTQLNQNKEDKEKPPQQQQQIKQPDQQIKIGQEEKKAANQNLIPQNQQRSEEVPQEKGRKMEKLNEQPIKQENGHGLNELEQQQQQKQPQQGQKQNQLKLNLDKVNLNTMGQDLVTRQQEFQNADTPKANKQNQQGASQKNNVQEQFAPPTAQPKLPDQLKRTQAGGSLQEESSPPPQPQLVNQISTNQGLIGQNAFLNTNQAPVQNTLFQSAPLQGQFQNNLYQNNAPQGGMAASAFIPQQQGLGLFNSSQFGSTSFFASGGQNQTTSQQSYKLNFSTGAVVQQQPPQVNQGLGFQIPPVNLNINPNMAQPRK
ncbi:hypothetical protein pb186bvf_016892 [Paramecium bursaria]